MPRKALAAAGAAAEAPAPASVLVVEALVECPAAAAQELADLALVAGRVQQVNQAAFGRVAVAVPVPEGVWEPAAPRVEEQATVRGAEEVRVREDPVAVAPVREGPVDPVVAALAVARAEESPLAAVGLVLALEVVVAERGRAAEALGLVAELVAGRPLVSG